MASIFFGITLLQISKNSIKQMFEVVLDHWKTIQTLHYTARPLNLDLIITT